MLPLTWCTAISKLCMELEIPICVFVQNKLACLNSVVTPPCTQHLVTLMGCNGRTVFFARTVVPDQNLPAVYSWRSYAIGIHQTKNNGL